MLLKGGHTYGMLEIPLNEAGDLAAVAARARRQQQPVWLSEDGRRVAAVIDAATLERLLRLQDQQRTHDGEPFEDGDKADLGL